MIPCKHASPGKTCLLKTTCRAALRGEPVDEMDCYEEASLWDIYQADQSYENCCAWLKHRAWMKGAGCE